MKNIAKHLSTKTLILSISLVTTLAGAQQRVQDRAPQRVDPIPQAPTPGMSSDGITKQAGAGGLEGFARAGVLELGGSASFTSANDFTQFSFAPSIGWFFMDNWQITAIMSWTRAATGDEPSSSTFSLLGEPSFHLPFTNSHFGFIGVGFGVATQTGANAGLAMAPRIGFKRLVGRSGVMTVDLRNTFAANDVIETPRGTALTVSNAVSLGIGYTVLW